MAQAINGLIQSGTASRSEVNWKRMTLGFFILPIVDTACAFLMHVVVWPYGPGDGGRWDPVDAATSFAAGVAIVSIPMTFGGAVPVVSWLVNRGRLSFGPVVAAAVAVGNVPVAIVSAGTLLAYGLGAATSSDVRHILIDAPLGVFNNGPIVGSVLGALSGLVFCFVAGIGKRNTT